MASKFQESLSQKTDNELQEYLNNRSNYREDAILAVIAELEQRGQSNSESESIKTSLEQETQPNNELLNFETPDGIPNSISKAAKFLYLSAALGVINPTIVQLTTEIENFSNPSNLAIILISTGLIAFFAYQINLGKKWARTVFLIVFLIGLIPAPLVIPDSFRLSPLIGIMSLAQFAIQGYALILLFKQDSKNWYLQRKQREGQN